MRISLGALRHGIADAGDDDGNQSDGEDAGSDAPIQVQATLQAGYDWSLPNWVTPSANSGFVAETVDATHHIYVRVFDLTWEQS